MAAPCARRSPLSRSGLTQAGRRRAELGGGHFRIDERDLADLILFGRRYARHIRYYNAANNADGDWSAFFENDVSASLAALAKLPVEPFLVFQRDLETWLKAEPDRDKDSLGAYFKLAFHLPLALLQNAGAIAEKLPPDHAMKRQIGELARRELAEPIRALIGWYKGATEAGARQVFADEGVSAAAYKLAAGESDRRLRLSSSIQGALLDRKSILEEPLPAILVDAIPPGDWAGIWADVDPDTAPYRDATGAQLRYEQIYDALEFNLLESAIRNLYRAAARMKREAQSHLRDSFEAFGGHLPHYGLWLAFLRLFEHAQKALNGFTDRHLDFYFREVLRLDSRSAIPDRVHLLFELAKGVETHRIAAGAAFRGGNDALGRPVSYALEQELIVNRGRIAAMHGLRIDPTSNGAIARASTEPRSRDGIGEQPLLPDSPAWSAFGPASAPAARIGFAVADRKLFLREGMRTIRLRAELARPLQGAPASDAFRVRLTGPEGWHDASSVLAVTLRDGDETGAASKGARARDARARSKEKGGRPSSSLEFAIELRGDAPPIVPFDPALHGDDEGEAGPPRAEIWLDFARPAAAAAFAGLEGLRLRDLELEVDVSGLKQLSLVAGGAVADPTKPFAPFGAQPRKGAALVVGSAEIFSKPIADWSLWIDWQQHYNSRDFFYAKDPANYVAAEAVLKDGRWEGASGGLALFGGGLTVRIDLEGADLIDADVAQTAENPPLTAASVSGFARLTLSDDFGHASYPHENARALVQFAKDELYYPPAGINAPTVAQTKFYAIAPGIPGAAVQVRARGGGAIETGKKLADTAGIRSWESVRDELDVFFDEPGGLPLAPYDPMVTRIEAAYRTKAGTVEAFVHLHPFGEVRARARGGALFPSLPFDGALLIGVADFEPPSRLSLLVQVADGSGDPLKKPPELGFHFLAGDRWVAFEDRDVDDKTGTFAGSGLIGLAVPEEADRHHSVMPDGLHWLRISAARDADALNRLLSIDAQAGRAAFVEAGNDPQFLATPLPAGTIAKLVVPDPAVKKVRQPYSSFGGRPAEAPDSFATRVSERLRHKDRAIAAFDYEALILDAFPQLYRAKCLPTTALVRDADGRIVADNEVAPGAVTVVTVPWTHGRNARDPLRPYADQALLVAVERFLRARVSPFVRLEVQNPKFEEVQADFRVRFHPDIADIAFYRDALNDALIEYLTPWARPGGGEIMFGGRLWKSALIDFIEERPEVDFVTDFQLYHKPDADAGAGGWTPVDVELIEATTARSILVSARRHGISEVAGNA